MNTDDGARRINNPGLLHQPTIGAGVQPASMPDVPFSSRPVPQSQIDQVPSVPRVQNSHPGYPELPPEPAHSPVAAAAVQTPSQPSRPRPAPDKSEVVLLSRQYRAHDVEVDRVLFRKPVGRDIARYGNMLKVDVEDGTVKDVEVKYDVAVKYIVALSEPPLPPSTVDEFEFTDIEGCASALAPFFMRFVA